MQAQAPTATGGGLASWLRLSSHLSKPQEGEQEAQLSPEDSVSTEGDSPSQPRSQLDFGAVAVQALRLPSPKAAPPPAPPAVVAQHEPPSPSPAATDATPAAASPAAATSVSPKPSQQAAQPRLTPVTAPAPAAAKPAVAAPTVAELARRHRGGIRSALLRAVLLLCLLGALAGAPAALLHLRPQLASHSGEPCSWRASA